MTLLQVGADSYQGLVATAACCKHHKTKHKTKDGLFVCSKIISVKDIQELFMLLKRKGGEQILFHSPNITAVGLTRLSPDITLSSTCLSTSISYLISRKKD